MILTTFGHNPDRLPLKRIFEGGVDTLTVAGTLAFEAHLMQSSQQFEYTGTVVM